MRHNRTRRRLKRNFSHRKQMLENMAASLLKHQQIKTTVPKAKEAQKLVDQLITLGKDDTLHARRKAFAILQDHALTTELFMKIAPRFKNRVGGYTRVLHLGPRKGDAAVLALLELTEKEVREKKTPLKKKAKAQEHEHAQGEEGHEHKGDVAPHAHEHEHKGRDKKQQQKTSFFKNIKTFFGRKQGGE